MAEKRSLPVKSGPDGTHGQGPTRSGMIATFTSLITIGLSANGSSAAFTMDMPDDCAFIASACPPRRAVSDITKKTNKPTDIIAANTSADAASAMAGQPATFGAEVANALVIPSHSH